MEKIGIFGGSFDPPHIGHIQAARAFIYACSLDRLFVIPSFCTPEKGKKQTASAEDRLAMAKLAFAPISDLCPVDISDCEINRGGRSFMADTVRCLSAERQAHYILLIGADKIKNLPCWKDIDVIVREASFAVIGRGADLPDEMLLASLRLSCHADISTITAKISPISSTQVRAALAKGENTDGLIPPSVADYIQRKELYR